MIRLHNNITAVVVLIAAAVSCSTVPADHKPITVSYESTYGTTPDGTSAPLTRIIAWSGSNTLLRVIAEAGGYSTPPHRHIYLVREGASTLLPDNRLLIDSKDDIPLRPGDRIEIRR